MPHVQIGDGAWMSCRLSFSVQRLYVHAGRCRVVICACDFYQRPFILINVAVSFLFGLLSVSQKSVPCLLTSRFPSGG